MLSQLALKVLQGSDPKKLQSAFYLVQLLTAGVIVLVYFWFKEKDSPSGFRVREADLRKKGQKPMSSQDDPLAQARFQKKAEPLRLAGISIHGEPHEILGLKMNATESEVRAAYRDLMKRYHPDRVGRPGTAEWKDAQKIAEAINEAKDKMLSALKAKK